MRVLAVSNVLIAPTFSNLRNFEPERDRQNCQNHVDRSLKISIDFISCFFGVVSFSVSKLRRIQKMKRSILLRLLVRWIAKMGARGNSPSCLGLSRPLLQTIDIVWAPPCGPPGWRGSRGPVGWSGPPDRRTRRCSTERRMYSTTLCIWNWKPESRNHNFSAPCFLQVFIPQAEKTKA